MLDCWRVLHWSLPRAPSPVNVVPLLPALHSHPDQQFAQYIKEGLQFSFRISFNQVHPLQSCAGNHPSATKHLAVVWEHVRTELIRGSLVGWPPPAADCVQLSPLGLLPKPQSNKWCLIVNLSAPAGASVNDGICLESCSLSYASVDDAVAIIQCLGQGTELVKMDLKYAYRVVPVHPQDHQLLGIQWDGGVYVDRSLPFGLRSAPLIFTAFADLVMLAIYRHGVRWLLHFLDNFRPRDSRNVSCCFIGCGGVCRHWYPGCLS